VAVDKIDSNMIVFLLFSILQREATVAVVAWQFEEMKSNQLKLEVKIIRLLTI